MLCNKDTVIAPPCHSRDTIYTSSFEVSAIQIRLGDNHPPATSTQANGVVSKINTSKPSPSRTRPSASTYYGMDLQQYGANQRRVSLGLKVLDTADSY